MPLPLPHLPTLPPVQPMPPMPPLPPMPPTPPILGFRNFASNRLFGYELLGYRLFINKLLG